MDSHKQQTNPSLSNSIGAVQNGTNSAHLAQSDRPDNFPQNLPSQMQQSNLQPTAQEQTQSASQDQAQFQFVQLLLQNLQKQDKNSKMLPSSQLPQKASNDALDINKTPVATIEQAMPQPSSKRISNQANSSSNGNPQLSELLSAQATALSAQGTSDRNKLLEVMQALQNQTNVAQKPKLQSCSDLDQGQASKTQFVSQGNLIQTAQQENAHSSTQMQNENRLAAQNPALPKNYVHLPQTVKITEKKADLCNNEIKGSESLEIGQSLLNFQNMNAATTLSTSSAFQNARQGLSNPHNNTIHINPLIKPNQIQNIVNRQYQDMPANSSDQLMNLQNINQQNPQQDTITIPILNNQSQQHVDIKMNTQPKSQINSRLSPSTQMKSEKKTNENNLESSSSNMIDQIVQNLQNAINQNSNQFNGGNQPGNLSYNKEIIQAQILKLKKLNNPSSNAEMLQPNQKVIKPEIVQKSQSNQQAQTLIAETATLDDTKQTQIQNFLNLQNILQQKLQNNSQILKTKQEEITKELDKNIQNYISSDNDQKHVSSSGDEGLRAKSAQVVFENQQTGQNQNLVIPTYSGETGSQKSVQQQAIFKTNPHTSSSDESNSLMQQKSSVSAQIGSISLGVATNGHNTDENDHDANNARTAEKLGIDISQMLEKAQLNQTQKNILHGIMGLNNQENCNHIIQKLQNFKDQQQQQMQSAFNKIQKINMQQQIQNEDDNKFRLNQNISVQAQNGNQLSTYGGQTTAAQTESNLTSIMSSKNPQQQNLQSQGKMYQQTAQSPNSNDDLQGQIKQLIQYLSVVSGTQPAKANDGLELINSKSQNTQYNLQNTGGLEAALTNKLSQSELKAIQQIPGLQQLIGKQSTQNHQVQNYPIQSSNQDVNQNQFGLLIQSLATGLKNGNSNSQINDQRQLTEIQQALGQLNTINQATNEQNQSLHQINNNAMLNGNQSSMFAPKQPNSSGSQHAQLSQLGMQLKVLNQINNETGGDNQTQQVMNQLIQQALQKGGQQVNQSQNLLTNPSFMNQFSSILGSILLNGKNGANQGNNLINQISQLNQLQNLAQLNSIVSGANNSDAGQNLAQKLSSLTDALANNGAYQPNRNQNNHFEMYKTQSDIQQLHQKEANPLTGLGQDINIYKDIILDEEEAEDQILQQSKNLLLKNQDDPAFQAHLSSMIDKQSKRIKKDNVLQMFHQQNLVGKSQSCRGSHEKIQDKGDYFLIHRLNGSTKRMNQILQCKRCPLKFPKLCNLRDHLRIHNDEMPFTCDLCGKPFTQAGNRDRHQKKRVCKKRKIESHEGLGDDDSMQFEMMNTNEQANNEAPRPTDLKPDTIQNDISINNQKETNQQMDDTEQESESEEQVQQMQQNNQLINQNAMQLMMQLDPAQLANLSQYQQFVANNQLQFAKIQNKNQDSNPALSGLQNKQPNDNAPETGETIQNNHEIKQESQSEKPNQ